MYISHEKFMCPRYNMSQINCNQKIKHPFTNNTPAQGNTVRYVRMYVSIIVIKNHLRGINTNIIPRKMCVFCAWNLTSQENFAFFLDRDVSYYLIKDIFRIVVV